MHARTKQGHHGPKGARAGDCEEAKRGGRAGAAHSHKAGKASKNSKKSKIVFSESLRIIERFRAYDMYLELLKDLTKNIFGRHTDTFIDAIKSFVFGEHHTSDVARMRECVSDRLCEVQQRLEDGGTQRLVFGLCCTHT